MSNNKPRWRWGLLGIPFALLSGCGPEGWTGGSWGRSAGLAAARPDSALARQNEAADKLSRLVRAGQFDEAHALAGEQSARCASAGDAVAGLWWRCQELGVYEREGRLDDRAELAGLLAAEPAARDSRFCLSAGWAELFAALVQAGRRTQAVRLLHDRYQSLLGIEEPSAWWQRQVAELSAQARDLGEADLALAAAGRARLAPQDPVGARLFPATRPDRTVQPMPEAR